MKTSFFRNTRSVLLWQLWVGCWLIAIVAFATGFKIGQMATLDSITEELQSLSKR